MKLYLFDTEWRGLLGKSPKSPLFLKIFAEFSLNRNAELLPRIHFDPKFPFKIYSCTHAPINKNCKFSYFP